MLFLDCYNLLKRAIRCDSSSELVFGYEVVFEKKKFCTINVKSRRIRTVSGLRSKDICNNFAGKVDSEDKMEIGRIAFATRKLPEWYGSRCCGFFYHPLAKEYRLLHVTQIGKSSYEYHIYEFGAHKWRTILTPKFSHYSPQSSAQLLVTKKAMFWWKFGCFLVFDINTEKVCMKGSPPLGHHADSKNVVVKGGEDLCCCYVRYRIVFATRKLPEWYGSRCCGFFYHPLAKEYRLLHVTQIGKSSYEYHIYEFGAHKWRTILTPEFSHYPPPSSDQLVVKEKALVVFSYLYGFRHKY
ncbi:Unknown protein [Striga hermonthica]|uniref:F-box protein n=1 Tax=Striga hermonthica TaxID=68872 RepID=A0A9N7RP86_STRHE|nr:Unknown protein [Striga hermonthica]